MVDHNINYDKRVKYKSTGTMMPVASLRVDKIHFLIKIKKSEFMIYIGKRIFDLNETS